MEQAQRNLATALTHERFARHDLPLVRKVATDLLRALDHLHLQGLVHCDLKVRGMRRVKMLLYLCRPDHPFADHPNIITLMMRLN